MKVKKSLAIFVAAVLIALPLSACGSNNASTPMQTLLADADIMELLEAASPVAAPWPLVDTPTTLSFFAQVSGSTVEDIETNAFTAWYEEQTGVTIDWQIVTSGAGQQIPLMIAGGDLPDAFIGNLTNMQVQAFSLLDRVFVPLTESIANYGPNIVNMLKETEQARQFSFMPDGEIYSLLRVVDTLNERVTKRAWVYQPWLELLDMDLPQTTDEFYNMLVRFRDEIPALIGVDEIVPMAGAMHNNPANNEIESYIMNAFLFYDFESYLMRDENDVVHFVANTEEYREGLRFLNKLFNEGLLTDESWTQGRPGLLAMTEGLEQNIVGVVTAMFWGHFTTEGGPLGRDLEFVSLPALEGPEGVRWAFDRGLLVNNGMLVATTANQNVDLTIQLADWFFDPFTMMEAGYNSVLGPVDVGWRHAEPGELNPFGEQALFSYLRPPDNRQNDNWFQVMPYYWPGSFVLESFADNDLNRKESFGGNETLKNYMPYSAFHLRLPFLHAPLEYLDEYSRISEDLRNRQTGEVSLWRDRFITGQMCLDNDWQAYLDTLDRVGLDRYVEVNQIMYDRYLDLTGGR
ncbi:MAG: extracellular solute-binding protein [Defluviitaleaceae bacterium]|nr:extracellular solute-binding protein [Defluviitaleaceae bacterium]